ncbi:MAG: DUF86 domain-containing protein [Thermoanaerobaculia bacterium]|nr:DUF86 domain-containing protein [Thermoanaerobaculia bacterium]
MTDVDLVARRLAFLETYVADLRRLARPELLRTDVREERFVAHTLQLAIQAALDVASHIVSDDHLGEPESNRDLFDALAKGGWVSTDFAETLGQMADFRNVLVHGYTALNLDVLEKVSTERLEDLLRFSREVRAKLAER